jgi:hypothetical protein
MGGGFVSAQVFLTCRVEDSSFWVALNRMSKRRNCRSPEGARKRRRIESFAAGQNPIISNRVSVTLALIRAAVARCQAV